MLGKKILGCVMLIVILSLLFLPASFGWSLKQAPLMTRWASQVDPNNPLPEYPRPQLVRTNWLNLNGVWQFQRGYSSDAVPIGNNLSGDILVPFPIESAISGVMQHFDRAWYRRTFTIPPGWSGKQIMLNFGAVDWESQVYINGQSVGIHKGGFDAFSYNITPYLSGSGAQELIVRVYDPTDSGGQSRGKQVNNPSGIWYTPATGIWQTVWLEPVAATSIKDLKLIPDIDNSRLKLTVNTTGSASGVTFSAVVRDSGNVIATVTGNPNNELNVSIPNQKLWSPSNPFLYDLEVSLIQNNTAIDTVTSYFGMRKVQVATSGGYRKILLNNSFVYQFGPLDQGYWPDGIYTAPTDTALRFDIEKTKEFGFNMIRKHAKVEPARWYYWTDKLGMLVWQDMPSGNNSSAADKTQFETELGRLVQTHWNSPSIIMWVVFNEGWGQYDTERITNWTMGLDPSRIVSCASGWNDYEVGHIKDSHSYPSPSCPSSTTRAVVNGEYGGIGYQIDGHMWSINGNPYANVNNATDFVNTYDRYATSLTSFKTNNGLSAAVYTQITDVETELNGIMTYDRAVTKGNVYNSNIKLRTKLLNITNVLPTSQVTAQSWRYTTSPPASNWYATGFSDSGWSTGNAGFGTSGTPGAVIRTTWNTADIWLRKQFNPGSFTATDLSNMAFSLYHDEDCEIYINGVLAASVTGYTTSYVFISINQAAKNALIANGNNVIAVHCHQTSGGQGIDVGIVKLVYTDDGPTPTPTPTPPPSSYFSEDFDDGIANGLTTYDGSWSVVNGQYNVGAVAGAKSVAIGTNFSNFTYLADVSISGGDAGLVFRVSNPAVGIDAYNGYYAGLNSSGYVILGKASHNWTQLATYNMAIAANTLYRMKVVANGSNIQVFVTDMSTPKINYTDTSFSAGAIGVRTFNSAAKFDNISVTTGTVPTPTPTPIPSSFTDNFNDNVIGNAWSFYGGGAWSESGTILRQDSATQGDPCKAIISNSGTSFGGNHTILAKVYVDAWTDGDSARAGVSLYTGTGDGRGYNLLFHNNHSTVQFLDDGTAWGPSYTFNWSNRTWYWFKLKMENGTLYGKVWQDGAAEPGNWPYTWGRSGRSGYPALNGGTSGHGGSCIVFFDDVTVTVP